MAPRKKEKEEKISATNTLLNLADKLVSETKKLMHEVKGEAELRIEFERILMPALAEIGIKTAARYERLGGEVEVIHSGRPDAVHGQVIIEYEPPKSFAAPRNVQHAYDQLKNYFNLEAESTKADINKFIGIGFDGESIFFVRYKDRGNKKRDGKKLIGEDQFIIQGPYLFDSETSRTLLIHLRALARLPLTAENLATKFGPGSELAPKAVSAFANALEYWGNQTRIRTFYNEWKRLFGIVYGEKFGEGNESEATILSRMYQVGKDTDFQELLFSVHTYFAFLMKLIAAELLTLRETSFSSSLSSELAHISDEELRRKLDDMENGGVYARKGITNFLEGDFFRWYLDTFESPELRDAIREVARALSEFEPATTVIDPEASRDLIKKLYQYLVPREIRHKLGEYYTPDWLAELVLDEVGYDGNSLKRVLDPACGSGTFLVLAIQKVRQYAHNHKESKLETAKRIVHNVWGFDINPMAVIAARTNYLFALGDLAHELESFEIPIYLADSVLWPEQVGGQKELNLYGGDYVKVKTSVKEFRVPSLWVKDGGLLMREAAPLIEQFIKGGFEPKIAMEHFREKGLVSPSDEKIVENFYRDILDLEKEKRNNIWIRFLKNAFAPMVAGKFDFVIGNPPWIRWGYLSKEYREATLPLWKEYGLFSLKGHAARLGGGEKDFSMLFVYASSDYYLKDGAKLGFLITQEVFKSKGAGEGFRRFQLGNKQYLEVLKAHDLVSVKPFEDAANKTAAIILRKGKETKYPVPYIIWTKKKGVGKITVDKLLNDVSNLLGRKILKAKPIKTNVGAWQTVESGKEYLFDLVGNNYYKARQGADPQPYGVFLMEIIEKLSDGKILARNLSTSGKFITQKVERKIESNLVFPALRGSDIQRWLTVPEIYILMAQDPRKREPYPEAQMKNEWPYTYSYLTNFKELLLSRSSKSIRDLMKRTAFYAMFGIGPYTISNHKVVWKLMSNDIFASVISQFKTPLGYKIIIPTKTVAMFATNSEAEAHYLCAIINSNPVRDFIKSFSSAGRGFGTPSVMEHVGIPKFEPKNSFHQKLSEISKNCHQFKSEGKEKEIEKLEKENDELVKKLFNLKA